VDGDEVDPRDSHSPRDPADWPEQSSTGDVDGVAGRGSAIDADGMVDASALPPDLAVLVAQFTAAVDAMAALGDRAGVDVDGPQAAAVAVVLARGISRLGVTQARMLPVVEADGLWSLTAHSLPAWAAQALRLGKRAAQAQVHLGRQLRDHLPVTAAAAAAGDITVEHAHLMAQSATNTPQRLAVLADPDSPINETFLVREAQLTPLDRFRRTVAGWAREADPDADDRGYVEATDREYVTLDRTIDGYHLAGWLTPEHGTALTIALQAVTGVPAAGDGSTPGQRRGQALYALARVLLDNGLVGTGKACRPQIKVHVPFDTLQNLADRAHAADDGRELPDLPSAMTPQAVFDGAQFEDGTPISRALLDKLACDGELARFVFGPRAEVLDVGRSQRTFTNARREAIIARDRHCQYPGCTAPPVLGECHHVKHWTRDHGDTSVANGILLCWHHHDVVHRRHIEIHRRGTRWVFTHADGREIIDRRGRRPVERHGTARGAG
jgi:hypothetical protein